MLSPEIQRAIDALERRIVALEKELARDRTQLRSEVREEIEGMLIGIQSHISGAVRSEIDAKLTPLIDRLHKVDQIADDVQEVRDAAREARDYRLVREEREKILREEREREAAAAALRKSQAESSKLELETKIAYPESVWRRRAVAIGIVVSLVTALATVIGLAIASHK